MDTAPISPLQELHGFARTACVPSLCEAIRLLESDKFRELTGRDIQDVANYRGIELGDESFFHKAFTPGKEAAASLAFAQQLGPEVVLDDLQRLRESLGVETGISRRLRGPRKRLEARLGAVSDRSPRTGTG